VNLQLGRASGSLSIGVGDPAGVLAGISGHHFRQLQGEVVLLGHDLGPVGDGSIQGLVVLQPGGTQALVTHVGGTVENGRLASWKTIRYF